MYLYVALYLYVQYILEIMCFCMYICILGGLFFVYIYKMFCKFAINLIYLLITSAMNEKKKCRQVAMLLQESQN